MLQERWSSSRHTGTLTSVFALYNETVNGMTSLSILIQNHHGGDNVVLAMGSSSPRAPGLSFPALQNRTGANLELNKSNEQIIACVCVGGGW